MRISRSIVVGAGVLLAAAALLARAARPTPVEVETASATRGLLRVTVDGEGVTRVVDRYVITVPVTGRLERITLREGVPIAAGDVVARIHPAPLDASAGAQAMARLRAAEALARQADAQVTTARAALEQARRAAARSATLVAAGALAPADSEDAALARRAREDELTSAIARARAAAAEVEAARAATLGADPTRAAPVLPVRAPAAGRVLRVLERSERVVAAAPPLLELGDARTLEIVIDVLSSDAPRVHAGQRVRLERWGGDSALTGVVRTVEPAGFTRLSPLGVEEQRVNVIIDPIDPPPTLGDGYRVEGRIVIWEGARVLTVPPSALVRDASGWSVFAVEQGRARRRTVTVGHWSDAGVEILGGLAEGATVVAFPSDRVTDGVRVRSAP